MFTSAGRAPQYLCFALCLCDEVRQIPAAAAAGSGSMAPGPAGATSTLWRCRRASTAPPQRPRSSRPLLPGVS